MGPERPQESPKETYSPSDQLSSDEQSTSVTDSHEESSFFFRHKYENDDRPDENFCRQQPGSWENGIFTHGHVEGTLFTFLIDTGAAVTVMSRAAFQRIPQYRQPPIRSTETKVSGVGGTPLDVAGIAHMTLVFDGIPVVHDVLIVGMTLDAILWQDILLSHQCKVDLRELTLQLKDKNISCWTPGETTISCRVVVKDDVVNPAWSEKLVNVEVANAGYLAADGLVQPSPEVIAGKEILMMPGVVSTRNQTTQIRVINFGDSEASLHPR